MVDWVIDRRPLGPQPLVVVASPETATRSRASRSPCRTSHAAPATPSRRRATPLDGFDGDVLVLSGDTPLLTPALARRAARRRIARAGAAATVLSFEPPRPAQLRTDRPRRRRPARAASSRRPTRRREQLEIRELNSSIYVFDAERALAALDRLEPRNAQGELYLTDAVSHLVDGRRSASPSTVPTTRPSRRREHAGRARGRGGRAPRPRSTRRTCSPASRSSTRRRPGSTPPSTLEPDAVIAAVHRPPRRDAGRRGRRGRPARGRRRRADRARGARRPVLLPSPRHRPRGRREGRHVRGDEEVAHRRGGEGAAPRRTSATPTIGDGTNVGAGTVTANFRHKPGAGKRRTTSAATSRPASTMRSSRPSRSATARGSAPRSAITEDVPPDSLAAPRPARRPRRAMSARARRLTAALPGSS